MTPNRRIVTVAIFGSVCLTGIAAIIVWWKLGTNPAGAVKAKPQCAHWCIRRCCQLRGIPVEMPTITRLLPPDERGHSLLQLAEVFEKIGIGTEGRRETFERIAAGGLPCIARLRNPDHFVVVSVVEKDRVHVFDGCGHKRAMPAEAFRERWGGEILCLGPRLNDGPLPAYIPRASHRAPCIEFETLLVDKGTLPAVEKPVVFRYPFRNTGLADLVIEEVHADCECIETQKPQRAIPPGGQSAIELLYTVDRRRSAFFHSAVVATNDSRVPKILLTAAGYNPIHISIEPPKLDLGDIVCGRPHSTTCFLRYSGDWADFEVEEVTSSVEGTTLLQHSCSKPELPLVRRFYPDAPKNLQLPQDTRILRLSFSPPEGVLGRIEGTISICTNVKGYEELVVPVTARVVTPVRCYPDVLYFGEVSPNDDLRQTVTLVSTVGEAFQIDAVQPGDSDLQCTFSPSVVQRETTIEFAATGSGALRLAGKSVQIRGRLVNSGDELSLVLSVAAWERPELQNE